MLISFLRRLAPIPWTQVAAAAIATVSIAALSACSPNADSSYARSPGTGLGIDPEAMDKTVKPGDDFYAYANGTWMRQAIIPEDEAQLGAFQSARQRTEQQLVRLVADIAKGDAPPRQRPWPDQDLLHLLFGHPRDRGGRVGPGSG